ncbi:hypothetical protein V8E54_004378 [Elaphomyces granulatus]
MHFLILSVVAVLAALANVSNASVIGERQNVSGLPTVPTGLPTATAGCNLPGCLAAKAAVGLCDVTGALIPSSVPGTAAGVLACKKSAEENAKVKIMQGLFPTPIHSDGDSDSYSDSYSYSDNSDIGDTMNIFHLLQRAGPEIGFQRVWS